MGQVRELGDDEEIIAAERIGVHDILKGFLTIAEWSDFWTDIERGAVLNLIQATRHLRPKPRERIEIGQDILIVPCWSSWEFRLSPRFAERVQLFLSEFKGFPESS